LTANKNLKQILAFFIVIFFAQATHAYLGNIATGSDSLGFPAKLFIFGDRFSSEFNANLDFKGTYGSASGDLVPEIDLSGIGAEVGLSYRLTIFAVGAGYSAFKWYQLSKPEDVKNYNIQGTMKSSNIALGLDLAYWKLMYKYHLTSDYVFEKKTLKGASNTFSKPTASYSVAFTYRINLWSYLLLEYMNMTYTQSNGQDLAEKSYLNFRSYLVGFGFEL